MCMGCRFLLACSAADILCIILGLKTQSWTLTGSPLLDLRVLCQTAISAVSVMSTIERLAQISTAPTCGPGAHSSEPNLSFQDYTPRLDVPSCFLASADSSSVVRRLTFR